MKKAILALTVLHLTLNHARAASKCVQIYYDRAPSVAPEYTYGRTMALFLQNLLGHFPEIQQFVIPIEKYQKGQLERCQTNFYLGAYFDNAIPEAFLDDFSTTRTTAVWLGYNVWELGEARLRQALGVKYRGVASPDWKHLDKKKRPAFFKYYDYKGETFTKYSALAEGGVFLAASDVVILDPLSPHRSKRGDGPAAQTASSIVVKSRHSATGEAIPYVLRLGRRWFVADLPFNYLHEEDRYLIFADLLFDILDEPARNTGRIPAMVRFEDIHALVPSWQFKALRDAAKRAQIPFAVSLIPIFKDPYSVLAQTPQEREIPLNEAPEFVKVLKEATAEGGTLFMHGVTHQCDDRKNPLGTSGPDYEFWIAGTNSPLPDDATAMILERLERGKALVDDAGLKIAAWLTPHYAASAADNILFAQLFLWNVGRVFYSPFRATQKNRLPEALSFDRSGKEMNGKRLKWLEDLKVEIPADPGVTGQFMPFELYGDVYGQRLLPETAGYVRPGPVDGEESWSINDILRVLKRNRVLRDVWGSFFLHPFLVNSKVNGGIGDYEGDTREIERLFREVKLLGYEFVNPGDWTRGHQRPIRPAPVEVN